MNSEMLGNKRMGGLVLRMALPTIAAQLVNLLYSIVDKAFIGHIDGIGSDCLTGVGITMPIILIISAFSAFFGQGGAPIASIELGRGDRERAEKILGNCVTMLLALSVILMAAVAVFMRPILFAIGASEITYPYASEYLSYYLIGTVMVLLSMGLSPFIVAQGRSGVAMLASVAGGVINILLDWLFVSVLDMGVRGAAIATVISQSVSGLWILLFLLLKANDIKIKRENLKLDMGILKQVSSLGVSPFVMMSTESVIGFVMNSGLQSYGGELYVGGLTIMQSVMQFISTPLAGFTQGVTPILSYNYGAGNNDRLKSCMKIIFVCCFVYCASLAAVMSLVPRFFASLFTDSIPLLDLVERSLPVFIAGMFIFGIQRACQTTFVALGQAKVSLFIAMLRKIILLVPLAIILPRSLGAFGIYCAEPIADALAATTCGIIFATNIRKIIRRGPAPSKPSKA